jgi:hypothetical protein
MNRSRGSLVSLISKLRRSIQSCPGLIMSSGYTVGTPSFA